MDAIWYQVSIFSERTMLTGDFFVLFLRVVFFFMVSPAVPVFILVVFPQVNFWPMGSHWGGGLSVVVRGHPGDIPRFSIEIWMLGCNGCCVLVAGKLCPAECLSLVSVYSPK